MVCICPFSGGSQSWWLDRWRTSLVHFELFSIRKELLGDKPCAVHLHYSNKPDWARLAARIYRRGNTRAGNHRFVRCGATVPRLLDPEIFRQTAGFRSGALSDGINRQSDQEVGPQPDLSFLFFCWFEASVNIPDKRQARILGFKRRGSLGDT